MLPLQNVATFNLVIHLIIEILDMVFTIPTKGVFYKEIHSIIQIYFILRFKWHYHLQFHSFKYFEISHKSQFFKRNLKKLC